MATTPESKSRGIGTLLAGAGMFAAVWLLWSGQLEGHLLALGAASCLLVAWLASAAGFGQVGDYAIRRAAHLLRFWGWLAGEIIAANVAVARTVWRPTLHIEPGWVELDVADLADVDRVVLANAVTLTPATLSVGIADGRLEVHCLTDDAARQLHEGRMRRRVAALG